MHPVATPKPKRNLTINTALKTRTGPRKHDRERNQGRLTSSVSKSRHGRTPTRVYAPARRRRVRAPTVFARVGSRMDFRGSGFFAECVRWRSATDIYACLHISVAECHFACMPVSTSQWLNVTPTYVRKFPADFGRGSCGCAGCGVMLDCHRLHVSQAHSSVRAPGGKHNLFLFWRARGNALWWKEARNGWLFWTKISMDFSIHFTRSILQRTKR
jgi:hypothetical protein